MACWMAGWLGKRVMDGGIDRSMGGSVFERVSSLSLCLSVCWSLEILGYTNLVLVEEGSGEGGLDVVTIRVGCW